MTFTSTVEFGSHGGGRGAGGSLVVLVMDL